MTTRSSSDSRRSFGRSGIGRGGIGLSGGSRGFDRGRSGRPGVRGGSNRFVSDRYFSAYNRLDRSGSRLAWLSRNNYPSRAFGIGLSLSRSHHKGFGRRGGFGRLFGRGGFRSVIGHYGYPYNRFSRSRFNFGFGFGSFYRPFGFRRFCNPYSFSYYAPFGGYSSFWPGYSSYTENNYYYDDNNDVGNTYEKSYDDSYSQLPTNSPGNIQSSPTQTDGLHRELGERYFAEGRYDEARRTFVQAMLEAPDDAELLILYAYAHFAGGDYRMASSSLERALRLDPTLIDSPVDLVRLYREGAVLLHHMRRLDDHLSRLPNDQDARLLAGYVRYAAGRPDDAEPYFATVASARSDAIIAVLLRDATIRAQRLIQQGGSTGAPDSSGVIELIDENQSSLPPVSWRDDDVYEMQPMVLIDE